MASRRTAMGGVSASTQTPLMGARGAPPRTPSYNPRAHNASSQDHALLVGDGPPQPHPPRSREKGSGPRLHA